MSLRAATLFAPAAIALALSPLAAEAQSAAQFRAELAAPTTESQAIAGGVLWRCEGTSCTAPRNGKRPLRVCRELHRELGDIVSFEIDGEMLDEDTLARCNS